MTAAIAETRRGRRGRHEEHRARALDASPLTGDRMRAARVAYGLTVPQIADLLHVGRATVYRWEATGAATVGLGGLEAAVIRLMERFAAESKGRGDGHLAPAFVALAVEPATLPAAIARGGLDGLRALLDATYRRENDDRRRAMARTGYAR